MVIELSTEPALNPRTSEGAPDTTLVLVDAPHWHEPREVLRMKVGGTEVELGRESARSLAEHLLVFANTGRVSVHHLGGGLHGWNAGDLVGLRLVRADLTSEVIGPYMAVEFNSPGGTPGARDLAADLLDELAAQKPIPVVAAHVVAWRVR